MDLTNDWREIAFGVTALVWCFSTYRSVGALMGFIHIISDVTRLKIFEVSEPVAFDMLCKMGEKKKTISGLPRTAIRMVGWSVMWVLCLTMMFGLLIFK